MLQQHQQLPQNWAPAFDEGVAQHTTHKAQRSNKLARDMREKVLARRAEDRHIMELAEYHFPFMEA